ncbi:MAG TPA: CBS domain-containing protein [Candidatus Methylomirabilis sp.]|nr:CBS domain-containing protein [Candidatus Methylomirabilis sp.]
MRVRDLMSRHIVTIAPSDSCLEAVARMHQDRVRHLPVVNADRTLVGVVTDRDLRHHLFSPELFKDFGLVPVDVLLKGVPVAAIMSTDVITIAQNDDMVDAARRMREEKVGSLPVVEGGRVVGIITETDLLRHICRADAAASPACAEIIVSYP